MAPKKACERKEDIKGERRGKKKMVIKGPKDTSEEDVYVPPGFANVPLEAWAESERKKTLRSCSRPAERVIMPMEELIAIETGFCANQSCVPSPNTQGTESGKLVEEQLQLANSDVILLVMNETDQEMRPEKKKHGASNRFGSFHSSADNPGQDVSQPPCSENFEHAISLNSPEEKSSNMANQNQSASSDNSSIKINKGPVSVHPNSNNQGRTTTITLTEIARADGCNLDEDEVECPAFVTVAGCKVRVEFAATARNIENKHGDILGGSSFEGTLCSDLFEKVCGLYQKLEKVKLTVIKVEDLESMKKDVRDLLKVGMDVGWLSKRVDEICHAKAILSAAPNMKEIRNKQQERIWNLEMKMQRIKSELQEAENELESEKEDAARTRQAHILAKNEVMRFYNKSLAEGI